MNRKRAKLGDVIELRLDDGRFAYMQYVNEHTEPPVYGSLLRVFPGIFRVPVPDPSRLVESKEQFITFFPLGAGLRDGAMRIVASAPMPKDFEKWPLFKSYNENCDTGVRTWFLWNGSESRKIGKLHPDQIDMPQKGIINLTLLQELILKGWRHRDEVRPDDVQTE